MASNIVLLSGSGAAPAAKLRNGPWGALGPFGGTILDAMDAVDGPCHALPAPLSREGLISR